MIEDYCKLNQMGIAHSIEAYYENELVGGLYGLCLGQSFFGESMFYKMPEASKVCFAKLVDIAIENNFHFIYCQVPTPHLKKLGAIKIPRADFLTKLNYSITDETKNLNWNMV